MGPGSTLNIAPNIRVDLPCLHTNKHSDRTKRVKERCCCAWKLACIICAHKYTRSLGPSLLSLLCFALLCVLACRHGKCTLIFGSILRVFCTRNDVHHWNKHEL